MAIIWIRTFDCKTTTSRGDRSEGQWHAPGSRTWNDIYWCKFCGAVIRRVYKANDTIAGSWWWVTAFDIQEWP